MVALRLLATSAMALTTSSLSACAARCASSSCGGNIISAPPRPTAASRSATMTPTSLPSSSSRRENQQGALLFGGEATRPSSRAFSFLPISVLRQLPTASAGGNLSLPASVAAGTFGSSGSKDADGASEGDAGGVLCPPNG